jgi:group I intron endonuclease
VSIYKTVCVVNGKIYIGKTSKSDPNYLGSGLLLKRAIKKYGKENFKKEILEECKTIEELNEREKHWIKELRSTDHEVGYNIAFGGNGGDVFSNHPNKEMIRSKQSEIKKGKVQTEEAKRKMSESKMGEKNPMKHMTGERNHMFGRRGEKNPLFRKRRSSEVIKRAAKGHEKSLLQFSKEGKLLREWQSATQVRRETGLSDKHIGSVCKGNRSYAGGFIWKYA